MSLRANRALQGAHHAYLWMRLAPQFDAFDVSLVYKNIYNSLAVPITEPAADPREKSRDIAGDIARYWSHVNAFISIMTCAFAAAGSRHIANAVLINRSLIFLILLDIAEGSRGLGHFLQERGRIAGSMSCALGKSSTLEAVGRKFPDH